LTTIDAAQSREGVRLFAAIPRTPLWVLAGQVVILIATIIGFGLRQSVKPKLFDLLLALAVGALVVLGPRGNLRRIVVSIPFALYLLWWALSWVWTWDRDIYLLESQLILPASAMLTIAATVLPLARFKDALLLSFYGGILYNALYTVANLGPATSHTDGTSGWSGSVGHKNGLGPFVLVALLAILTLEEDARRRRIGIATCLFFIVMTQSTTTYIATGVLLPFAWFLRSVSTAPSNVRGTRLLSGAIIGAVIAIVVSAYSVTLLGFVGKDPTLTRRTEVWAGVIEASEAVPWTGYGIGGAWLGGPRVEPTRSIVEDLGFNVAHSHNGYLEIVLLLGIIGLVLFVNFLVAFVRTGYALMDSEPGLSRFSILFAAVVVLTSLTEVKTFGIWLMFLGMLHAAMLRAQIDERRRASAGSTAVGRARRQEPDVEAMPPDGRDGLDVSSGSQLTSNRSRGLTGEPTESPREL
jgi:exopolysaccharide production protein ExoQ